jgi:hypothetical protein
VLREPRWIRVPDLRKLRRGAQASGASDKLDQVKAINQEIVRTMCAAETSVLALVALVEYFDLMIMINHFHC